MKKFLLILAMVGGMSIGILPTVASAGTFTCYVGFSDASAIVVTDWNGANLSICYSWLGYACDTSAAHPDGRGKDLFTTIYHAPAGANTIRYQDGTVNHDLSYDGTTFISTDPNNLCTNVSGGGAPPVAGIPTATSSVDQMESNLGNSIYIFFVSVFFVVWLFRRRV